MNTIHLEEVLGSRGKIAVLRVLANVAVPLSIRQVAAQAGLSPAPTAEILDRLVSLGVVAATQAGKSRVHWLERRNLLVRELVLPALALEAGLVDAAVRELRAALPPTVYSAVLFGSRARTDHTTSSDYDVVVVEPDERTLQETLTHMDGLSTDLAASLGAPVSVLGYTLEDARGLLARGDNFMDGVVGDGVLLAGVSPRTWTVRE
jgi:predicted nucleotidyltransferase